MGAAALRIEDELVDFSDAVKTRPNPQLYLIQFRRNIANTFGNVIPISIKKGKWEIHSSYENEVAMLKTFREMEMRDNVRSGQYTFRCVWPDGRTLETKAAPVAIH